MVRQMGIATILLEKQQQDMIKGKVSRILEQYDSFVLVEAEESDLKALKNQGFKVIPRDEPREIMLGGQSIRTDQMRFEKGGRVLDHPSYSHTMDPGPEKHHYIVQFIGPIKEEWKREVTKLGGTIRDPLPSYSYIVEMDGHAREAVAGLPFVRWMGHYDPDYRIARDLLEEIAYKERAPIEAMGARISSSMDRSPPMTSTPSLDNTFLIVFQTKELMEQSEQEIHSIGANVVNKHSASRSMTVSFPLEAPEMINKIKKIAGIHGVLTVEPIRLRKLHNNKAIKIIAGSSEGSAPNLPLAGEVEIIAIADSGLDTGEPETIHEDFQGRIEGIRSWPVSASLENMAFNIGADDGPADKTEGHGTHVAGSALGDGSMSKKYGKEPARGFAHKARLFFQAVEQEMKWKFETYRMLYGTFSLAGIPDDLNMLFQEAYDSGARIHTNSWGGGKFGTYDYESRDVDGFAWTHKDMIILFAAGNDGKDSDKDGKIEYQSVTPPGTAKNCINVGASENLRLDIKKTYKDLDWAKFPKDPIATDRIADNPDDIAAFSSRGPCLDGRFKPDIVSPGTVILSTRSRWGREIAFETFRDVYTYMDGTSMATPLTAGAVALVRQYLRQIIQKTPSAALIKAALLHTANRKRYRHAASDPGQALWDPDQGWGHTNLAPFFSPKSGWSMNFLDIADGLLTGQIWDRTFEVNSREYPVKATLVWTDYPSVADVYPNLVNNLNLIVTAPSGKEYHGNVFDPPYDQSLDSINNVETVLILEPEPGIYKITVLAMDVKEGPQDFALVYSGGLAT